MKHNWIVILLVASGTAITGCVTPGGERDNTATGALTGGAFGATSGALIGASRGNAGAGALIGGAIGVIGGGLIGHSLDEQQQERLRRQSPATYARMDQGQPLSVADVKELSRAGVSEDVIISQVENSHTVFHLSTADIIDMKNAGVSERVIDFMINTPHSAFASASVQTSYAPPPPAPAETVIVSPGPGYVWIGGEWIWNGRWSWIGGHWGVPPYAHAGWVPGHWNPGPHGFHRVPGRWIRR
jgi:outer membrane lipoprotein SlyB